MLIFSSIFYLISIFQPLLIQCRLFHDGYAVKGTLLVNRKVMILHFKPLYVKFLNYESNLLVYYTVMMHVARAIQPILQINLIHLREQEYKVSCPE